MAAETIAVGSSHYKSVLELLGILLDAFAELDWAATALYNGEPIEVTAARLFVDVVWRKDEEAEVAVGILDRLALRAGAFALRVAFDIARTILAKLRNELDDPYAAIFAGRESRLQSIEPIFEACLNIMWSSEDADASRAIEDALLKPLSVLLGQILERTVNEPSDDHLAQLDATATRLYDLCDQALPSKPV